MINSVGFYNYNPNNVGFSAQNVAQVPASFVQSPLNWTLSGSFMNKTTSPALAPTNTRLAAQDDIKMYNDILNAFATSSTEKISPVDNGLRQAKLDALLKNGTLLNRNSDNGSSTLENIHKALTTKRAADISGEKVAGQIIDALYNPAIITQKFGDIPNEAKVYILDKQDAQNSMIDVTNSGTCVAASVEFHMANKHPAEFSRWAADLTSPNVAVEKNVNLSALSKNTMDGIRLLRDFGVKPDNFNFHRPQITLKPDANAITRAQIQDNYWDRGERTILDVMIQSTLMQLGSQQSYDSLTDTRGGTLTDNPNPYGLVEYEKTFIESIVENTERTSVVYQNVDNNQNLVGWNCDMNVIQKHITDAIDSGEDVIIGYVLTAQECNEAADNPNKIVNGHEITIVDYKKDALGRMTFICNDTDDEKNQYIEYPASYILPKIHHASYASEILENQNPGCKFAA